MLERLGRIVGGRRGRWVTLAVWFAVIGLLSSVFPQSNAMTVENSPNLKEDSLSVLAEAVSAREFPNETGVPALIVFHRADGLTEADAAKLQAITQQLETEPLPAQTMVPPLHKLPPQALFGSYSEDGTTIVVPVFFDAAAETDVLGEAVTALQEETERLIGENPFEADPESGAFAARVTGPVGIQVDAVGLFKSADITLLIATVLLVLVLLLIIYRSPVLAIIPLIGVGCAYGVVSPLLGWFAQEGWVTFDSQGISIMTVLLFGAGTDYCLFLITRYRQTLKNREDKFTALKEAVGGAAGAVAMSGMTVVVALFALLLAEYGSYQRFAIPFSLSILIMLLASLTLVPALLAIIGRASFWPFIPRTDEQLAERSRRTGKPLPKKRGAGFGDRVGRLVTEHPRAVAITTTLLLGSLAVFSIGVKINFDTLSSFPEDMQSREGFAIIGERYSEGELAPVKLMVDTEGKEVALAEALDGLDDVAETAAPVPGAVNPDIVAYEVTLAINPYSNEAMDLMPELRETAEAALADAGITHVSDKLWIAGQTAKQYDTREMTKDDTMRVIPVVIVLIALLLVAYLRSIAATIYLLATVLLSYLSALGLGWIIIHYGFGADFIAGAIPLYSFVFLVALGEDYNIFMVSSIWQKRKTMPLRQAIREGVAQTGGVITSAGLILAGTFAVLATMPIQVLVHFGIITALGILLDTLIVRPFLVPAITTLLGRFAFWPGRCEPVREAGRE